MRFKSVTPGLVLGLLLSNSWGCGPNLKLPDMAKVKGKVTYNGSPVTNGTISFFPVGGKDKADNPAVGQLGSDGSFELTTYDTGDGAVLGQHKAIVVVKPIGGEEVPPDRIPSQLPEDIKKRQGIKPPIPPKYSDPESTPLRYTVRQGGNNFDIELKD